MNCSSIVYAYVSYARIKRLVSFSNFSPGTKEARRARVDHETIKIEEIAAQIKSPRIIIRVALYNLKREGVIKPIGVRSPAHKEERQNNRVPQLAQERILTAQEKGFLEVGDFAADGYSPQEVARSEGANDRFVIASECKPTAYPLGYQSLYAPHTVRSWSFKEGRFYFFTTIC